ncbi:peptidoglycan-binding protein [Methylopila henanensis]|uniref:Peptidoglycan-binding protein n=1 Tax=Methylopila henanensis TaxID=873516 RepID=A0ABW4KA16_9HYPH
MPKAMARTYDDDASAATGLAGGMFAVARRRPVDTLAALVAAAGVATILVNALALQEGRHPAALQREAPAQHGAARTDAAPAPQRSELVAQIQEALLARGYYDGAVDGVFGAKTSAAISTFEQASGTAVTGVASDRVLAALLVAPANAARVAPLPPRAEPPAARPQPATTGSISAPKLMAVQRALARLGYGPVAIDGKMGAATRAALLSFERDRKLPQTGEPGPQVLRELKAVSGMPLE